MLVEMVQFGDYMIGSQARVCLCNICNRIKIELVHGHILVIFVFVSLKA